MFEKASRLKLRYTSKRGSLNTEDLWDLPLSELDTIAIALNKEVKDTSELSFITVRKKSNVELELKFEIVKHVIQVKLAEKDAKDKQATMRAQKQKIMEIIETKKDQALGSKSIEELQQELLAMEDI